MASASAKIEGKDVNDYELTQYFGVLKCCQAKRDFSREWLVIYPFFSNAHIFRLEMTLLLLQL